MNINIKQVKTVLTKSNLPDADYVINPYIGCGHGCIYCYADFMKRFTGHAGEKWGEFVDVKINAAETIPITKNFENAVVLLGSVTDPYQQVEAKYQITRQILERLLPLQPNLEILTKSKLIVRDIDLLQKFKNLKVGISMNTLDKTISRKLEPHASSPQSRINTLKQLQEQEIKTYLFVSPIFPGITKPQELIETTQDFVKEYCFENLNIRPNNKTAIESFIQNNYPDLKELYATLQTNHTIWNNLKEEITKLCTEKKIKFKLYFKHANERKNRK